MLFSLFFSLNYCFAAVVLIATNKVEYTNVHRAVKILGRSTDGGGLCLKFFKIILFYHGATA